MTVAREAENTLAGALRYAFEGRASHRLWAEHLEAHANGGTACEQCTPEVVKTAGDASEQREWVRKYDVIIKALSQTEGGTGLLLEGIAKIANEEERKARVKAVRHALRYRAALAALRESSPAGVRCTCYEAGRDPMCPDHGSTAGRVCHTSPDAQADAQTPHNAMVRDDAALIEALRFWVDRADRFEANLPPERRYMRARGVLHPSYAIGRTAALAAAVPEAGKDAVVRDEAPLGEARDVREITRSHYARWQNALELIADTSPEGTFAGDLARRALAAASDQETA